MAIRRCAAGHVVASGTHNRSPCPSCRVEAVAARVSAADPALSPEVIAQAIEATATSSAVLRELAGALAGGPGALFAGAPPTVGRLVGELIARGSALPAPRCAVCGRENQRLVLSGSTGVCPRCRGHQLAVACSRCGKIRPVGARDAAGLPVCFRCSDKPERRCGSCGELRPVARRATATSPDVCVRCYRLPLAVCSCCGKTKGCNFIGEGHPICKSCSPRRELTCAHCGRVRPPSALWPEGPVCEPCYRTALSRRGACAGCGQERRLVSPPGPAARLCRDCAGVAPLAVCRECGAEERPYEAGRCVRCALAARAKEKLQDASGTVPPALTALYSSIAAARQPYSALNWLRSGAGAALLTDLASGALALTHEALDAGPRRGGAEYLRQMLVANGALAPRNEGLAGLERWVQAKLTEIPRPEDRRLVQAYATWAVMGRLRRRAAAGGVVRTATAKIRIGAAVRLARWLDERRLRLGELSQADVEAWLAADPPSSYDVRDFLRWAAERKLVARLEVQVLASRTGTALEEERRWQIVERLLHDDGVDLTDRVAGCLLLLYAQQLSRIVAIKVEDVITSGGVRLRLGSEELAIPEPLDGLIARLAATGRRYMGVGTPATTPWLFPGLLPGRPLTAARLGDRLGKLGVDARAGRRAALMHLAARLPAAVLAEVLNLSPGTAVDWVRLAGGDWSSYAAQVARDRDREMC